MKIETKDNPLANILVRRNAINEHGLREMMNHVQGAPVEDLSVFDPIKSNQTGETHWRTDKSIRDTQVVPFQTQRGNIFPQIEHLMQDTVRNIINPFFGIKMRPYHRHLAASILHRLLEQIVWQFQLCEDLTKRTAGPQYRYFRCSLVDDHSLPKKVLAFEVDLHQLNHHKKCFSKRF